MKPTFTHESDFRRERDFGTKISATFEFLGAQFKPLLKCLVYFVLPGTLILGIGMGMLFGNVFAIMPKPGSTMSGAPDFSSVALSLVSGAGLAGLGLIAGLVLLISTVYGFVRVRLDTPPAEVVQPAQVWAYIRPRLGRMLLAGLLLVGLSVVLMGAMGASMFGIIGSAGSSSGLGTGLAVFVLVMIIYVAFVWIAVLLSLYFPVLWIEDVDVWTALRRSFYLVQGKWWSTFGLLMISTFIQTFFTYIFAIPMYGIMMVQMLKLPGFSSPIITVIAASVYAIGTIFTYAIPLMAIQFQYFNLVERKDGLGMRMMVDSLGKQPAPQASNAHYRPDEEGEY